MNTRRSKELMAGILALSLLPSLAAAQSSIPREETWVTNGIVQAIARTTDTVYIGGDFTYVGPLYRTRHRSKGSRPDVRRPG